MVKASDKRAVLLSRSLFVQELTLVWPLTTPNEVCDEPWHRSGCALSVAPTLMRRGSVCARPQARPPPRLRMQPPRASYADKPSLPTSNRASSYITDVYNAVARTAADGQYSPFARRIVPNDDSVVATPLDEAR